MRTDKTSNGETRRVIGRLGGFAIVAGSMLGIGIFLSPPIVAKYVPSAEGFFAMWLLGGLTALAGAVACAELGTMMPRAGGDYVFQYEAFGPSVAFASGWVLFAAIFCGSIAAMAVGLCTYQLPLLLGVDLSKTVAELPLIGPLPGTHVAAVLLIVAVTGLNALGASSSARVQSLLTLLPIGSLAILSVYAIMTGADSAQPLAAASAAPTTVTLDGLIAAYMAVYFAYAGWISIIYVAGEVEAPQRNIPFALLSGTLVVTALYLLLCFGFVRVLGMDGLRESGEAGSATAAVLAGSTGKLVVTSLIASALLAATNATVLGGARVAYAMAERGAAWSWLAALGQRHHAPYRALWLQAAIASLLTVTGTFERLLSMVSLAMVVTGSLTVSSLFALRAARPDAPRPYRATGYPWLPAVYLVSSAVVVVVMLARALRGARADSYPLLGLLILVAAYALHRGLARRA